MSLSVALIDKAEAVEKILAHCLHYFNVEIRRFDSIEHFHPQWQKEKWDMLFMDWDFNPKDLPRNLDFIKHIQPVPVILMYQPKHATQIEKTPQIAALHRIKKPLKPAELRRLFASLSPVSNETALHNFLRFPSLDGNLTNKSGQQQQNDKADSPINQTGPEALPKASALITVPGPTKTNEKLELSSFGSGAGDKSPENFAQAKKDTKSPSFLSGKKPLLEIQKIPFPTKTVQNSGPLLEDKKKSASEADKELASEESAKLRNLKGILSQAALGLKENTKASEPKSLTAVSQSPPLKEDTRRQEALPPAAPYKKVPQTKVSQTTVADSATANKAEKAPLDSASAQKQKPLLPLEKTVFDGPPSATDLSDKGLVVGKEEETEIGVEASPRQARAENPPLSQSALGREAKEHREKEHVERKSLEPHVFDKEQLNIDENTKNDFAPMAMKSAPDTQDEVLEKKTFIMSEEDILRTLKKYKDSLEFQNLMERVLSEQAEKALSGFLQGLNRADFLKQPLHAFQQSQSFREILKKEVAQYIKAHLPLAVKEVAEREIKKITGE